MIYGVISDLPQSGSLISGFTSLNEILKCENCFLHELDWGNFEGGYLSHVNHPYCEADFVHKDEEKGIIVLLSGAIYNRLELAFRLKSEKKYRGDPELIMDAFLQWGDSFVCELNGDFSIFIYNKNSGVFYLYRDHMGVRSLSYSAENGRMWFSTDGLSLCRALYSAEGLNPRFMLNCCVKMGIPAVPLLEDHFVLPHDNLKKVLPGYYIRFSGNSLVAKKYWFPENQKVNKTLIFSDTVSHLKQLVSDAVKIRCDSRFVAGAHVSSGLDSSLVAALTRENYRSQETFYGFSWTPMGEYKDPKDYDEREFVVDLGRKSDIKPLFLPSNEDAWIDYFSDPGDLSDFFSENIVRKAARSRNINLLFSGWGGDEFLSINNIGLDSEMFFRMNWRSFFKVNPAKSPRKLANVLLYHIFLPALHVRFISCKRNLKEYSGYFNDKANAKFRTINDLYHWHLRRDMHANNLYNYHIPGRTEDWFIAGYKEGIEYRYPLIDRRIIEFMLILPYTLFVEKNLDRVFIREVARDILPSEILNNLSKNDPVRSAWYKKTMKEICTLNLLKFDEFVGNPDFFFIDFEKLSRDIGLFRQGELQELPETACKILFFLRKMSEFTKGYHASTN